MIAERRTINRPIEVRAKDGEATRIVGHASVFFRREDPGTQYELWPGAFERFHPGVFAKAIIEDDVRALVNHDANRLLGRNTAGTLALSEDDVGLSFDVTPPDTELARQTIESLRRGDMSGASIAFLPRENNGEFWEEEEDLMIRNIISSHLYDVGPVTFPAFTAADSGVRADSDIDEARKSFEIWKSRSTAWKRNHRERSLHLAGKGLGLPRAAK